MESSMDKKYYLDAALNGERRKLKKFLDRGFSTELRDENGRTPLYLACQGCNIATVSLLIERMADSNSRCYDGSTPVHIAGLSGNVKIISKLINAGGDLRLHDYKHRSIYEWASKNPDEKKKKKMLAFLLKQRLVAMSYSPNCKDMKAMNDSNPPRREDLVNHYLKSNWTSFVHPVFSLGFGIMVFNGGQEMCVQASINLVAESCLKHDEYGCTYNNGPFIVMESMNWGNTKVTVKRLHTFPPIGGCVDLLIRECNYMAKLRHSNVMLLMGVCQTIQMDGLILVFERMHYGSLFSVIYIKAETPTVQEMCLILCQVGDAVAFLHQRNLLHSCITSHAIHMTSRTSAKIGNFEYMLENNTDDLPVPAPCLLENRYMNSCYNWMAPEVMANNAVTEKADLYSLTCVLWELIHGQPPWSGIDAGDIEVEMLRNHSSVHIKDSIQNPFHCLLQYGLARDIAERQLSVSQLRDVLHGFIMDEESQGMHHMTCISLSMDPGDPASRSFTDIHPSQSIDIRSSEVSVTDREDGNEVSYSQVSATNFIKPRILEELGDKVVDCKEKISLVLPEQDHKKAANDEDEEGVVSDRSGQVNVNDTTLICENSYNSRDASTQTFLHVEVGTNICASGVEKDDESLPEILTPEDLKTDFPKFSTPNKVPLLNLDEEFGEQDLKITDEDIDKVFSEDNSNQVHKGTSSAKVSDESENNHEVYIEEKVEIANVQKPLQEIPKIILVENGTETSEQEGRNQISVISEDTRDTGQNIKDTLTESDSQSQLEPEVGVSKSRFSILSFLSSKSSKKSTDQDSAGEKESKNLGKSLKKNKKKPSERNLKHKKAVTESSDDQTDSQCMQNSTKKAFFAGRKIRRSGNDKEESGDRNVEATVQRNKTKVSEVQNPPSTETLHARLSSYKIDISGIDKLDTELSSKTQSENEEVLKVHDIPTIKECSCEETVKTGSNNSPSGNPFKKFLNSGDSDIFTDEIKAILAKPLKMPKLPSQYSKTNLYSRSSIEKKPPSMAETLIRLYSPTHSYSNVRSQTYHAPFSEKASSLPLISAGHRGITSPHGQDRSVSSAHSSHCDSSHLDASESNTSSVTMKPASHRVSNVSPFTTHTEHFAFPKSPRETTQPGTVSAHSMLLKELQNYHSSHGSLGSNMALLNEVTSKKEGKSEKERSNLGHVTSNISSKFKSSLAHQISTVVSPRQSYLTKPEVSPRDKEEDLNTKEVEETAEIRQWQSSPQKGDKGWTGPAVARARFFGLNGPNEICRSDTLVHAKQHGTGRIRSDKVHSSIDQARSPATQKQYSKGATFPRVDGIGVHTTGIHSVKDMTASFQKQLEEHFRKQAILVKKKKEGIPNCFEQISLDRFITPQHLRYQTLPARLSQVHAVTAIGDQHQSAGRKISHLNIELQKPVGLTHIVKPAQPKDNSFLNASTVCEQAFSRDINAATPAKCHRSSDENDEELCSFVEDLINTTHEEVVQKYAHKDCVHITPVKPSTDAGNVSCQLNFSNSNNNSPGDCQGEVRRSTGSCDSGSANQWQRQQKRASTESNMSKKTDGDIEEFYFDDVIHPDLWKERHMRLQSTLALDPEANTNISLKITDSKGSPVQKLEFEKSPVLDTPTYPPSAVSSKRFKVSHHITQVTEDEGDEMEHGDVNYSNNSDLVIDV